MLAQPAIVFVGGLHPRKGLPDLLQAFERVHRRNGKAHLYIVGGGPFQETYSTLASGLSCASAITFAGAQGDPYPWMLGADIFALPSHADPAPLVLSEAREAGCAIVATSVDGIPELLEQGRAGILVPPHDPEAMADALLSLIDQPETLRAWKEKSQVNIDHMRIDRVAQETLAVYALARQRRSSPVAMSDRSRA
ncbi:glycosyltransferase family 4 protein [Methylobacterium sp. 77]|uniref:glycosyltransferase family 4 protein n=1 Tax=Methylobacterium sp. 77 TaxID=1101192 RepID=UPI0032AF17D1